jgi:Xaa-Pro aminopeptidase
VDASLFDILMPKGGMLDEMAAKMAENGVKIAAVEEATLALSAYERFKVKFAGVDIVPGASALIDTLRLYKDEEEFASMARAQAITDAAFAHILGQMTPEMTEIDVALELEYFMRKQGAEGLAFSTIAVSGSASSLPHGVSRPRKLERGFLTKDFGAKVNGYCSDMTRTVVLGRADSEMKRLYNTVLSAQKAALEAAREGVFCKALDKIARDIIDGAGYQGCFGHSLGHGVGMVVHEDPRLAPSAKEESVLERGYTMTFEPGIYIPGKYGCRIEDMACIRPDGSFFDFTTSPKELIELF